MTEPKCKHDVDLTTDRVSDEYIEHERVVIDVWCKKCGKSGSSILYACEVDFGDEECDE